MELTMAILLHLPRAKKWPITALELPEINKPQARISGVEISNSLQQIQTPAIEVTSISALDMDSCQIEFKNNLVLGLTVQVCRFVWKATWTLVLFLQMNTLPCLR
jgi:hypothetical protein